jgi:hypothetical protein
MRCETVAVGCHPLPIGLFEPFSGLSYLPPVAPAGLHKRSIPSASACAGGGSPLYRERVDDSERERKAD